MKALAQLLIVVLLMGVGAYAYDRIVTEPLRQQLKNPLIDRALLEKVLEAAAKGGATPERPVNVEVRVPGAPDIRMPPVTVTFRPPQPATGTQPAQPPRVVADAPTILCRTEEECRRIYGASAQSITVDAQVRTGTLVTVCTEPLRDGACPAGKEANLPLAKPLAFQLQAVQTERGIFHGLQVAGAPVEITRFRTETRVEVNIPAPALPYHLGLVARAGTSGTFTGVRYVNRVWRGFYEIEGGYAWPGYGVNVGFVFPIR